MTRDGHSRILEAYLNRVKVGDLRAIVNLIDEAWHQQANGNAESQRKAANRITTACRAAIAGVIDHDIANIEAITNHAAKENCRLIHDGSADGTAEDPENHDNA